MKSDKVHNSDYMNFLKELDLVSSSINERKRA